MHLMLAVRQGLTAVDAILRTCARAVGLERSEALVLGMIHARPRSAGDLAWFTGQPRQQAQRCLRGLQARGLVEPAAVLRGKVVAWGVTAPGRFIWAGLSEQLRAYELIVDERVSLQTLVESLERVVEIVVNRPRSDGWRKGLVVPYVVRKP